MDSNPTDHATSYVPLPARESSTSAHVPPEPYLQAAQCADPHDPIPPTRASWLRMYTLCIANFGISGAWALEFAITTPFFETGLKAGAVLSHSVWVVGPLSGLIVAPIVGALSDRCTSSYGRRRPFIVAGVLSTVLGMLLFANARVVAAWLFPDGSKAHKWAAILVAIFAFCVADLAINTTMWPVRALQGDLVPHFQQHDLQSASIVMGSLGDLAANLLVHSFEQPVTRIQLVFFIGVLFYSATVLVLIVAGREQPLSEDDPSLEDARRHSMNILDYLRGIPPWLWRVGGTYGLGFFTLFCVMPNASSWLGSSVLGGDPSAEDGSKGAMAYEQGVNVYGRAGLVRATAQIVYSAVYPWMLKLLTPGQLMAASFGIFGVVVLIFAGTKSLWVAELVVVLMALPMAAHFTVPVGMTVENSGTSNRGRYLGALNCFAVIPQLIDTLYTGYISRAWGEAAVMSVGGIWAVLTAISALLYMRI